MTQTRDGFLEFFRKIQNIDPGMPKIPKLLAEFECEYIHEIPESDQQRFLDRLAICAKPNNQPTEGKT